MSDRDTRAWDGTNKYHGTWWPGAERETSFRGFVAFDDRRPILTIESPLIGQRVFGLAHPPVVHGELDSGEKVTLWDLGGHALEFLGNREGSMWHARRFTYAILGEHLESHEKQRFRFSAYRLHGLGVWGAMDAPIPRDLAYEALPQHAPAYLTNFERDDSGTEYSAVARLEHPRRLETDARFPTGAIVNHTGEHARVIFECNPPAPARVHDLLLFDLQALLTFSYQSGAPLESEWLAIDDLEQSLHVMRIDPYTGRTPSGHVFRQKMILTTESAEPSALFPAWWNAVEELYPATQVISLYHHGSRGLLEGSVSSVIAVAEHLHGIMGPTQTRFADGFLESKKEQLKAAFPGNENTEFRAFMYEALRNNRPTLKTRLQELLSAVTPDRLELLGIDPTLWVADVRSVRDLLAHTSSHVKRRGSDSSALLDRVNAQSRAIVTILILKKMGLAAGALDRAAQVLSGELKRFKVDSPPQ